MQIRREGRKGGIDISSLREGSISLTSNGTGYFTGRNKNTKKHHEWRQRWVVGSTGEDEFPEAEAERTGELKSDSR